MDLKSFQKQKFKNFFLIFDLMLDNLIKFDLLRISEE
jgi:hypothetical protein